MVILFSLVVIANFVHYKGWGSNEKYYLSQGGFEIECDYMPLQPPSNCKPITTSNNFPNVEKGTISLKP